MAAYGEHHTASDQANSLGTADQLVALLTEAQAEVERLRLATPSHLRGDGPCQDCGSLNIVWFTDNVVWNAVMEAEKHVFASDRPETGILCPFCFVKRAEDAGLQPTGWRITPEWPWRTDALADAATPETEQAP